MSDNPVSSLQTPDDVARQAAAFRETFDDLRRAISAVIVGQQVVVDQALLAIAIGGHVLLEGVPGLGKTELVKTLASALDLPFKRIQFTPDLMPADIVGTNLIVERPGGGKEFQFQPGPVFTNILLADEVNRATPKTQSALLEAMQERSVTSSGEVRRLSEPFFVLATQNPLEMEGTYPLPEAQLDRFLFKVLVPFPTVDELEQIVTRTTGGSAAAQVTPVANGPRLLEMRATLRAVPVAPEVLRYAMRLARATHADSPEATASVKRYVRCGCSPRGAQALVLGAKAIALLEGRYHVAFADIHRVAAPALRHRVLLNFEGQADGVTTDDVVQQLLAEVPRTE